MPTRPKLKLDVVEKLIREGYGDSDIIKMPEALVDPSNPPQRQAVSQIRAKLNLKKPRRIDRRTLAKQLKPDFELDEIGEYLIETMATAKEVKRLRQQLAATQNELLNAKQDLKIAQENVKVMEDRKRRWDLAKQQGEIGGE